MFILVLPLQKSFGLPSLQISRLSVFAWAQAFKSLTCFEEQPVPFLPVPSPLTCGAAAHPRRGAAAHPKDRLHPPSASAA